MNDKLREERSELRLTVRPDNNVNSEVPTNSNISAKVHLYEMWPEEILISFYYLILTYSL